VKFYADKFKRNRELKKISVVAASNNLGIDRSTLWAWENSKRIPSEANIRAMAKLLNIDIREISTLEPLKELQIHNFSNQVQALLNITAFNDEKRKFNIKSLKHNIEILEKELLNSSTIINALLISSDISFYIKDIENRYIVANKSFMEKIKLKTSFNVIGKIDKDFFQAKEAKINSIIDMKVLNTGESKMQYEDYIPGTRKKKWGLISKHPIFETTGKTIGLIGIFIDISKQFKIKNELLENKQALEKRIKELNCFYQISKFFEYPDTTIQETYQAIVDIIPLSFQYPEITCARLKINEKEFKTTNFSVSQLKISCPVVISDKIEGILEVYFLREIPVVYDNIFLKEEKKLLNAVGELLEEITERKSAEFALIQSEEKYRNFLENLRDIAYETDIYGNIIYCNKIAEEATGIPLNDIINNPFIPLFVKESQIIASDIFPRILNGERLSFELTFKNGRTFQYNSEQRKDNTGKVVGTFGIGREILKMI